MRRVFCALLVLALLPLTVLQPRAALAEETDPMDNLEVPNCIVVDQNDPTIVLYERNADDKSIPGSTMKIMTCILAIELCKDLEQEVTITGQAASLKETNSLMGVIRGETLTVRQLLYGLMLESGNDAQSGLSPLGQRRFEAGQFLHRREFINHHPDPAIVRRR